MSSCPPLKPIEKSRYRLINFAELAGISRSLFTRTANTPSKKKRSVGLVRFEMSS
jgi:hypothetical protein